MLSTITVRSTLAGSRSIRIDTLAVCALIEAANDRVKSDARTAKRIIAVLLLGDCSFVPSVLKMQSSRGVASQYLTALRLGEMQLVDLSHRLEIAHRHRIVGADHHAIGACDFDQILQSRH